MSVLNLDLTNASANTGKTVLDTGVYSVKITSCEAKENKAKTGGYLEVLFTVTEGVAQGKSIINRYNIMNANADTVKYALNDIKTILTHGGHANPNHLKDSDEMLGLELRVSVEKVDAPWTNDKNEVVEGFEQKFVGYFKPEANAPVAAPASKPQAAPTPASPPAPQPTQAPAPAPTAAAAAAPAGQFPWQK